MTNNELTPQEASKFDPSVYPPDALFHERRSRRDRRVTQIEGAPSSERYPERRLRKERRRRVDPTTFDKQYTPAEIEFMNAMEYFRVQQAKPFPTYREVLEVARALGYRKVAGPVDCAR